jgi:hypothetical protein
MTDEPEELPTACENCDWEDTELHRYGDEWLCAYCVDGKDTATMLDAGSRRLFSRWLNLLESRVTCALARQLHPSAVHPRFQSLGGTTDDRPVPRDDVESAGGDEGDG